MHESEVAMKMSYTDCTQVVWCSVKAATKTHSKYLKWGTNKDLLYSTWNSAQCYAAAWMGGRFGGGGLNTCILKSKDITLPTKVCRVKAMVFPGVKYGCESWTIKKAER